MTELKRGSYSTLLRRVHGALIEERQREEREKQAGHLVLLKRRKIGKDLQSQLHRQHNYIQHSLSQDCTCGMEEIIRSSIISEQLVDILLLKSLLVAGLELASRRCILREESHAFTRRSLAAANEKRKHVIRSDYEFTSDLEGLSEPREGDNRNEKCERPHFNDKPQTVLDDGDSNNEVQTRQKTSKLKKKDRNPITEIEHTTEPSPVTSKKVKQPDNMDKDTTRTQQETINLSSPTTGIKQSKPKELLEMKSILQSEQPLVLEMTTTTSNRKQQSTSYNYSKDVKPPSVSSKKCKQLVDETISPSKHIKQPVRVKGVKECSSPSPTKIIDNNKTTSTIKSSEDITRRGQSSNTSPVTEPQQGNKVLNKSLHTTPISVSKLATESPQSKTTSSQPSNKINKPTPESLQISKEESPSKIKSNESLSKSTKGRQSIRQAKMILHEAKITSHLMQVRHSLEEQQNSEDKEQINNKCADTLEQLHKKQTTVSDTDNRTDKKETSKRSPTSDYNPIQQHKESDTCRVKGKNENSKSTSSNPLPSPVDQKKRKTKTEVPNAEPSNTAVRERQSTEPKPEDGIDQKKRKDKTERLIAEPSKQDQIVQQMKTSELHSEEEGGQSLGKKKDSEADQIKKLNKSEKQKRNPTKHSLPAEPHLEEPVVPAGKKKPSEADKQSQRSKHNTSQNILSKEPSDKIEDENHKQQQQQGRFHQTETDTQLFPKQLGEDDDQKKKKEKSEKVKKSTTSSDHSPTITTATAKNDPVGTQKKEKTEKIKKVLHVDDQQETSRSVTSERELWDSNLDLEKHLADAAKRVMEAHAQHIRNELSKKEEGRRTRTSQTLLQVHSLTMTRELMSREGILRGIVERSFCNALSKMQPLKPSPPQYVDGGKDVGFDKSNRSQSMISCIRKHKTVDNTITQRLRRRQTDGDLSKQSTHSAFTHSPRQILSNNTPPSKTENIIPSLLSQSKISSAPSKATHAKSDKVSSYIEEGSYKKRLSVVNDICESSSIEPQHSTSSRLSHKTSQQKQHNNIHQDPTEHQSPGELLGTRKVLHHPSSEAAKQLSSKEDHSQNIIPRDSPPSGCEEIRSKVKNRQPKHVKAPCSLPPIGAIIKIRGLKSRKEFNGREGWVTKYYNGHLCVRIDGMGVQDFILRPENYIVPQKHRRISETMLPTLPCAVVAS